MAPPQWPSDPGRKLDARMALSWTNVIRYIHTKCIVYTVYTIITLYTVYIHDIEIYIYRIFTISSWLKDWRDHSVSWIFQLRQRSLHACGLVWWYTVTRRPFCGGDGDGFGRHSGFGARRRRRRRLSGGGDGLFRYQHRVPKSPQQFLRHQVEVLIISRQPASEGCYEGRSGFAFEDMNACIRAALWLQKMNLGKVQVLRA